VSVSYIARGGVTTQLNQESGEWKNSCSYFTTPKLAPKAWSQ
jgi:hypothetical protein